MWTFPIIEKLGGRGAVAMIVRRFPSGDPVPVTVDTVRMWVSRNSIPGYALRQLIAEAQKRKITLSARDFERCKKEDAA